MIGGEKGACMFLEAARSWMPPVPGADMYRWGTVSMRRAVDTPWMGSTEALRYTRGGVSDEAARQARRGESHAPLVNSP